MLIIPAIDLKDGKCVRLRQGRMDDSTVFGDDPVDMATRWVDATVKSSRPSLANTRICRSRLAAVFVRRKPSRPI